MASSNSVLLEAGTNELEIIEFYLDERAPGAAAPSRGYYGVNVVKVLEVIESPRLTAYDSAEHPCFLGTIPLRDIILPVLDLSVWLHMDKAPNSFEVILVTEFNKTITGFLVSGVTQIHRVSWKDVSPPSQYLNRMESNCITSMVEIDDHFTLLLDLEKVLTELDPNFGTEEMPLAPLSQRGFKALIVDDSTILRHMIKQRLEDAGFEIETQNNGEEAWNYIRGLQKKGEKEGKRVLDYFDILISDIEMPKMDGYTLTKQVKDDPTLNNIPVILFSSLISEELRHKGDSVGADDQVSKPEFASLATRATRLILRNHPELAAESV